MPFFFIFKQLRARKGPGKFFMGSWKVLDFFVSKRVGTLSGVVVVVVVAVAVVVVVIVVVIVAVVVVIVIAAAAAAAHS